MGGAFMICAGPACPGWPGWGLRRTWQTKFLITNPARSQELRLFISATTFLESAALLWKNGEPTLAGFLRGCPKSAKSI